MGRAERRKRAHGHRDNNVKQNKGQRTGDATRHAFLGMCCDQQALRHKRTHSVHYFNHNWSPFHNFQFQFYVVEGKSRAYGEVETMEKKMRVLERFMAGEGQCREEELKLLNEMHVEEELIT